MTKAFIICKNKDCKKKFWARDTRKYHSKACFYDDLSKNKIPKRQRPNIYKSLGVKRFKRKEIIDKV